MPQAVSDTHHFTKILHFPVFARGPLTPQVAETVRLVQYRTFCGERLRQRESYAGYAKEVAFCGATSTAGCGSLMHRVGKEFDLPPFSFMLLRRIKEEPGITLSELCPAGRQPPRATRRRPWEQLVQDGYVEKRADPSDQRVIRLHMTEAGRRFFASLGDRAQGVWTLVLSEFDGDTKMSPIFSTLLLAALERANARIESESERD